VLRAKKPLDLLDVVFFDPCLYAAGLAVIFVLYAVPSLCPSYPNVIADTAIAVGDLRPARPT
jgi:hypothetical protein